METVPAFIDLHVHLREPGFEYKEDIESGSRAARAGGYSSILCMPNTKPANDNPETTRYILRRAREVGLVRVFPVGAISKNLEGRELADIEGMAGEGVIAVSDDGSCVRNESLMRRAMEIAKKLGLLVIDHPEDFSITRGGVINEGRVSKELGLRGIPREAENGAIERDMVLAKETGARLHIAHVSTKEGVEMIRRAKGEGLLVTCEATPHHLLLIEDDVPRLGANAKMKPPLRTEADRLALVDALRDGTIDAVATDHAPHAAREKRDLASAAFGVIGLETAFSACMMLVHRGDIGLERLIELFTTGPARVAGIAPDGRRATIDPGAEFTVDPSKFKSKARNTPFAGMKLKGLVEVEG